MTVLIVPEAMAPDLRRYVANNGRIYTTHAGQAAAAPKPAGDDASRDSTAALYARVGLSPEAPDFVLEAARRAFARRFHPDSAASRDDPDASSAEFRYFMRIFDVLQERRKRARP